MPNVEQIAALSFELELTSSNQAIARPENAGVVPVVDHLHTVRRHAVKLGDLARNSARDGYAAVREAAYRLFHESGSLIYGCFLRLGETKLPVALRGAECRQMKRGHE